MYRFHLTVQLSLLDYHNPDEFEYTNIIIPHCYGLKRDKLLTERLYLYRFHPTDQLLRLEWKYINIIILIQILMIGNGNIWE